MKKLNKGEVGRYPVLTDGETIVAYDSEVFHILKTETIYHIGNQLRDYFSNDPQAILAKVGKCGVTESRPAELRLRNEPHSFYPPHYEFVRFLD